MACLGDDELEIKKQTSLATQYDLVIVVKVVKSSRHNICFMRLHSHQHLDDNHCIQSHFDSPTIY